MSDPKVPRLGGDEDGFLRLPIARKATFQPDAMISGQPPIRAIHLVMEGTVRVSLLARDGRERVLLYLTRGSIFGEQQALAEEDGPTRKTASMTKQARPIQAHVPIAFLGPRWCIREFSPFIHNHSYSRCRAGAACRAAPRRGRSRLASPARLSPARAVGEREGVARARFRPARSAPPAAGRRGAARGLSPGSAPVLSGCATRDQGLKD